MLYNIFFSPSGGTAKVARILGNAFGGAQEVDFTPFNSDLSKLKLNTEDTVIVSAPSFAGRLPELAAARLRQLNGNGAQAVLVIVFGNRAIDDTLLELSDLLSANNFRCIAGIEAVAEHSVVRQYGAGRPDAADKSDLENFARQIAAKQAAGNDQMPEFPGKRPYRDLMKFPLKPVTNDQCTKCGMCASSCPAEAIPADKPWETDVEKCISCMGCIALCPAKARNLPAAMQQTMTKNLQAVCESRKSNRLYL